MLLIKNALVYTMEDSGVLDNTDILCEDGRITSIGRNITADGCPVIDATGLIVTPGLVDAHTHAGGFDINDGDLNEITDPVTPQLSAAHGIDIHSADFKDMCKYGITSCCFIPGSANVICGTGFVAKTAGKNNLRELILLDPAAMKCAMGGNPKGCYGEKGKMPMTRMGIAHLLRDTLRKAKEYMTKSEKAGGDPAKMPPYDARLEALIPVLRREIPLKIHCEQFDMLTAISIAKEFECRYTLEHAWASDRYEDELVEGGGAINFGPIGVAEGCGELTGGDVAFVKTLDERGLLVSLITDGPLLGPQVLQISAGEAVRCGVAHERALRMITINPAAALQVQERVGSIKIGKDADLTIWNAIPALETCAKPVYTIIDGEIVYSDI